MTKHRVWRIRLLLLAALAGWCLLVFSFSAQNAESSSQLSGSVCERVATLMVPHFGSLPETRQQEIVSFLQTPVRKTAHFCEYALGGGLFMGLLLTVPLRRGGQVAGATLWGAVCAALDEWHQSFVDGRGPGIFDVLLDTTGALAGALAVWLLLAAVCRRKRRRKRPVLAKLKKM